MTSLEQSNSETLKQTSSSSKKTASSKKDGAATTNIVTAPVVVATEAPVEKKSRSKKTVVEAAADTTVSAPPPVVDGAADPAAAPPADVAVRHKKKRSRQFETYLSKIAKHISSDNGLSSNAKQQLNSVLCLFAKEVAGYARTLTTLAKKKTVSEEQLRTALRLLLTPALFDSVDAFATAKAAKYVEDKKEVESRQEHAGLVFPPSITEHCIRYVTRSLMVTRTAPIYFSAVIEYVANLILRLAIDGVKQTTHVRITIRDLELAVRNNVDLNSLFVRSRLQFLGGGVLPNIHKELLVKKPRKRVKTAAAAPADGASTAEGGDAAAPADGKKAAHRFRPGTVSLREIRKYQKASDCLIFAKHPFERLVRSIISRYNEKMKVSKEVFIIIQHFVEKWVVDLLRDSNAAAIHANRVKLMNTDIDFVMSLRH